jgi:hypothetical protein
VVAAWIARWADAAARQAFSGIVEMLQAEDRRRREHEAASRPAPQPAGRHDRYNLEERHFWQGRAEFGDCAWGWGWRRDGGPLTTAQSTTS